MDLLIIVVDVIFLAGAVFNIYWQSQIEIRSIYKISSLIFAAFIGSWLLFSATNDLPYIIMTASFITLTIMNGVGGIGEKKVIMNGFYSGVIDYAQIVHVTLIPIEIPQRKPKVAVIFNTKRTQQIQMSFNTSYKTVQDYLSNKLSSGVQVEVGQI